MVRAFHEVQHVTREIMRSLFLFLLFGLFPLGVFSQSYLQLVDMGEACFNKKDWVCAERYLLEAVTTFPENKYNRHTYLNLGNAQRNQGKIAEAWNSMEKGIRSDPAYVPGYVSRAELRLELKDYTGALRDYSRVLRLEPQHEKALLGSVIASKATGNVEAAHDYAQRLMQFHPENKLGKELLGQIDHMNQQQYGAKNY
jgi:tetratricopeptide (TPR) repeat protein